MICPICSCNRARLASLGCPRASAVAVLIAVLVLSASEAAAFFDDFEVPGLTGWSVLNTDGAAAVWTVSQGELLGTGDGDQAAIDSIILTDEVFGRDVSLQLNLRYISGFVNPGDGFASEPAYYVILRYTDPDNYIYLRINPVDICSACGLGPDVLIKEMVAGVPRLLDTVIDLFPTGVPAEDPSVVVSTLSVSLTDLRVQVSFNGRPDMPPYDKYLPFVNRGAGRFGLGVPEGDTPASAGVSAFDNVQVVTTGFGPLGPVPPEFVALDTDGSAASWGTIGTELQGTGDGDSTAPDSLLLTTDSYGPDVSVQIRTRYISGFANPGDGFSTEPAYYVILRYTDPDNYIYLRVNPVDLCSACGLGPDVMIKEMVAGVPHLLDTVGGLFPTGVPPNNTGSLFSRLSVRLRDLRIQISHNDKPDAGYDEYLPFVNRAAGAVGIGVPDGDSAISAGVSQFEVDQIVSIGTSPLGPVPVGWSALDTDGTAGQWGMSAGELQGTGDAVPSAVDSILLTDESFGPDFSMEVDLRYISGFVNPGDGFASEPAYYVILRYTDPDNYIYLRINPVDICSACGLGPDVLIVEVIGGSRFTRGSVGIYPTGVSPADPSSTVSTLAVTLSGQRIQLSFNGHPDPEYDQILAFQHLGAGRVGVGVPEGANATQAGVTQFVRIDVDGESLLPTSPFLRSPLESTTDMRLRSPYRAPINAIFDHSYNDQIVFELPPGSESSDTDIVAIAFSAESGAGNGQGSPECFDKGAPVVLYGNYEPVLSGFEEHVCYSGHSGIDYNVPADTDVVAAATGYVAVFCPCPACNATCGSGVDGEDAVTLKIYHDNGFTTGYGHLSAIESKFLPDPALGIGKFIDTGVVAVQGEKIGNSGSTGTSVTHLHFGLKSEYSGNLTDPYPYRGQNNRWLSPCEDGIDNDGDLAVDWPGDPGCESTADISESVDCADWIDNDLDGLIDYPEDPDCASASDTTEMPEPGIPLGVTAGALLLYRLHRRRMNRVS